jgi:hypothetical protein
MLSLLCNIISLCKRDLFYRISSLVFVGGAVHGISICPVPIISVSVIVIVV